MPSAGDQPGWAPDPERPGMLRWWNGLGWSDARKAPDASTDRTMSAVTQALQSSTVTAQDVQKAASSKATQVVPGLAAQTGSSTASKVGAAAATGAKVGAANPFATAATALGVLALGFGLWGVLPLVGLVLSLAGLVRSRRLAGNGEKRTGFGQSLVGLVLSVVGLIRWLPLIAELPQGIEGFLNS